MTRKPLPEVCCDSGLKDEANVIGIVHGYGTGANFLQGYIGLL